jgi:uncharacterized membrane protein YidH (DUF202 family)
MYPMVFYPPLMTGIKKFYPSLLIILIAILLIILVYLHFQQRIERIDEKMTKRTSYIIESSIKPNA